MLTILGSIISAFVIETGIKDFFGMSGKFYGYFWPLVIGIMVVSSIAKKAKVPCIRPAIMTVPVITFMMGWGSEYVKLGFFKALVGCIVIFVFILLSVYSLSLNEGVFLNKVVGHLLLLGSSFVNGLCLFLLVDEVYDFYKMDLEKLRSQLVFIVVVVTLISYVIELMMAKRARAL